MSEISDFLLTTSRSNVDFLKFFLFDPFFFNCIILYVIYAPTFYLFLLAFLLAAHFSFFFMLVWFFGSY